MCTIGGGGALSFLWGYLCFLLPLVCLCVFPVGFTTSDFEIRVGGFAECFTHSYKLMVVGTIAVICISPMLIWGTLPHYRSLLPPP